MAHERFGYYSLVKDKLSPIRTQSLLNAYARGVRNPASLEEILKKQNYELTRIIGDHSEEKFVRFALQSEIVKSVREASPLNDAYDGIDKWVDFQPFTKLPSLPVQVKSSQMRVDKYKQSHDFEALNEMQIVINCGPSISKKLFQLQFNAEISRIRRILNSNV